MRIGTKILLLMLLITVGACATVSWIVTLNVTSYETERANDQILLAIGNYIRHLNERHAQIIRIVQALLEAPAQRSLLQAADDSTDTASREQLRQEVFGRDVQTELASQDGEPQFHVLLNQANELLLTSAAHDPALQAFLSSPQVRWPVDAVLAAAKPVIQYIATPSGLFVAMGVPLHAQLNEAPTHAYFVGFRVDDNWVRKQLLADRVSSEIKGPPLNAWFMVNGAIVARASSNPADQSLDAFSASVPLQPNQRTGSKNAESEGVEFIAQRQHFLGRIGDLSAIGAKSAKLLLASSLTEALRPLHRLQWEILITVAIACLVVIALCRWFALLISRPIEALVEGTRKIAAAQFDNPVQIQRRDELGVLADSFNKMAQGLKERDELREQRVKVEHDLALARKIQMDVLPKLPLPTCPGYDIAAFSNPAEQTGGDIYDLVAMTLDPSDTVGPPSLVLLLADATGHGIGPALSVTQVRSMIRMGVRLRASLDEILSQINRQLCNDLGQQRFVTAFLGLLDPSANRINYRSAGQAPLLHFHGKNHRFEWLDSSMLPLGIDEDPQSDGERHMQLEPGDLIVLLTDGFYEYHNPQGEQFGHERIAEVILQRHHESARKILEEILKATREFAAGAPQNDDMTAVIIRRLPPD